jgi:hypothetical protein
MREPLKKVLHKVSRARFCTAVCTTGNTGSEGTHFRHLSGRKKGKPLGDILVAVDAATVKCLSQNERRTERERSWRNRLKSR